MTKLKVQIKFKVQMTNYLSFNLRSYYGEVGFGF